MMNIDEIQKLNPKDAKSRYHIKRSYMEERRDAFYENPLYWDNRLRRSTAIKKRLSLIALSYLLEDKTLKQVGEENNLSPERIRQIVVRVLQFVWRESRKKNIDMAKLNEELFAEAKELLNQGMTYESVAEEIGLSKGLVGYINLNNSVEEVRGKMRENGKNARDKKKSKDSQPSMRSVAKEEFDKIKELLYRGESKKDIEAMTGRGWFVITRVDEADSFEEYGVKEDTQEDAKTVLDQAIAGYISRMVRQETRQLREESAILKAKLSKLKEIL